MSSDPNTIIRGGVPRTHPSAFVYEQTAATYEKIAGRVMMQGTAWGQLKLNSGTGIPLCVADKLEELPGIDASGDYDPAYAKDGEPIRTWWYGSFLYLGALATSMTIVAGDKLYGGALGLHTKQTTGKIACALAMEPATTTAAVKEDLLCLWTGAGFAAP